MVYFEDSIRKQINNGVDLLADAVRVTLGPKGKNVLIYSKPYENAYLTKDGVSVAKAVFSTNNIEDAAIRILRDASVKTAKEAGDGTTTSTILAQSFYKEGLKFLKNHSLVELKEEFNDVVTSVNDHLKLHSKTVKSTDIKELKSIATISANNDTTIGNLIANAYSKCGENGVVLFELSPNGQTFVKEIEGTQIMEGLISSEFITDQKKMECSYDNPSIFLCNNIISSFNDIIDIVRETAQKDTPLVIVANDFSDNTLRGIVRNNYQGNTKILPIKVTGFAGNRANFFLDLRAVTGAAVFENTTQTKSMRSEVFLGHCDRVVSTMTSTVFYTSNKDNELLKDRIEQLRGQIEYSKKSNPDIVPSIEKQIARLSGKVAIIYVGGKTEVETKERYDRVEDAVCATKAALQEGIIDGGGTALLRVSREISDNFFSTSLKSVFKQLCINSELNFPTLEEKVTNDLGWNFLTDRQENLIDNGVIDPTKVIRTSVENAASVAYMLLTTKAVVVDD